MRDHVIRKFGGDVFDELTSNAMASPRLRQHYNIHNSFEDPCQRFLNAIEPGSYLRPSRHAAVPRSKLLVALRGRFATVVFDDEGAIIEIVPFGKDDDTGIPAAIEVTPGIWNSVLSLAPGSILLEVKAGPFHPDDPREFAPWAPEEKSAAAREYLTWLEDAVNQRLSDAQMNMGEV